MWPVAIQPAAVLVWEPVHSGGVASGHPTSCCHCMGAIPFRWGGQWPVNQLLSLYGSHSIQEGWPVASQQAAVLVWESFHSGEVASGHVQTSCYPAGQ